ncbi:hypothetical protein TNCV_1437381 [Trichonephila clavipes]|nr:hypothetical protein TNCV_1437381 [Trichonephila clavipes]
MTIDDLLEMQEQDTEGLESLDPVQSEDRMTGFAGLARSLPSESWIKRVIRLRRDLSVQLKSSPNLISTAVHRTLKPLKFIIPHALGMQHWLLRWCH